LKAYTLPEWYRDAKFGFKDVILTWKAGKFDADHLIGLYMKAGAQYSCSMGVHHDSDHAIALRLTRA
jgi:alpha-L-fucosidase